MYKPRGLSGGRPMVATDLSIGQVVSKQSLYGGQLAGREGVFGVPFSQSV